MEQILLWLWPLAQVILYVLLGFAVVILAGALKTFAETRSGSQHTFDWSLVLAYAGTAVQAVSQIFKVRPEGLSDEEWNSLRFQKANDLVIAYAKSLGFTINEDFLESIEGAIEAAVKAAKPGPLTHGLLGQGSFPTLSTGVQPAPALYS